jgi:hypothetical protein
MPPFEQLIGLPEWIVVVGVAPWWLRRVLELARDVDVYVAERPRRTRGGDGPCGADDRVSL